MLRVLHEMYPRAPIYTAFFDERAMMPFFPQARIVPSFLERMRRVVPYRFLLSFLPLAFETFDLRKYDVVISSSSAFAKGVVTSGESVHICYCHTPPRFLWEDRTYAFGRLPRIVRLFAVPFSHWLRIWDVHAAQRPDYYIANSRHTASRIKKYYQRDAEVVYPPLSLNTFPVSQEKAGSVVAERLKGSIQDAGTASKIKEFLAARGGDATDYFLLVSQLRPYKRVDIAVNAFSKLGLPLVVIGEGPERKRLERVACSNVRFLGWVDDQTLRWWYTHAIACVFPTEDDFGLVPIEAMSFGKPVLALGKGGARETIQEGEHGEFFEDQSPESLADGVRRILEGIREGRYDPESIMARSREFSKERFVREFHAFVENAIKNINL